MNPAFRKFPEGELTDTPIGSWACFEVDTLFFGSRAC